jgi:hypothetical protein
VNFRHNGTHAANAVLPPPACTPPPTDNTMAVEEHFAFKATCESRGQQNLQRLPHLRRSHLPQGQG